MPIVLQQDNGAPSVTLLPLLSWLRLITKKGRGLCFPPHSKGALAVVKALDARAARKQRLP